MYLCKASLYAIALWWSVKNTTVLLCTLSLAGVAVCPEVTPLGPNRPSQHNTSVLVGVVCQPCCNEWGVTVPSQQFLKPLFIEVKKDFEKNCMPSFLIPSQDPAVLLPNMSTAGVWWKIGLFPSPLLLMYFSLSISTHPLLNLTKHIQQAHRQCCLQVLRTVNYCSLHLTV